jgi:DNA replication and repair protein RecF
MKINKIEVANFRNYQKREWNLGEVTVIKGDNGTGKSNFMEAVYLLATGKSFRADVEGEMIRYGDTFSSISGVTDRGSLRIFLSDGASGYARKKFEVNGISKRMVDFSGIVKAVLFGPADMELVTGSPSVRRRYLDLVLSQREREYRRCLVSYEKGLRQRNRLLDKIRDGEAGRNQLFFWDKLLIKNGNYLTLKRQEFLDFVNLKQREGMFFHLQYDKSVISEERLLQYADEEVAAGSTLVGPHRDDFTIEQITGKPTSPLTPLLTSGEGNLRDVSKFGSRGQQRMAVLWMKLGERDYLITDGELPILLLDDVFSELDQHRDQVGMLVREQEEKEGQVIMTTADEHLIPATNNWDIIKI